ncbi:DUF6090 family protein [Lacinutrix iliipiscaria]|uniref:DUF6090 family protein n=1 Tax=Lacinutrix iliipiscaria TaxID=1230532 RepID=A0ABW5WPZ1_9FLAO
MLLENKTGKYVKYAIGEIVLVVIGILIALQINNWNEKRKLNDTIKDVYSIVKSDLLSDIAMIDKVLLYTQFRDSIFKRVINRNISFDDYLKCNQCMTILGGFPDIKLKTRGLELLRQNSTVINPNQDSLSNEISEFYSISHTEIDVSTKEVTIDWKDNRAYFKKNMTWFEDYTNSKINEEFINYALSSIDYRNRVISFHELYYEIYLNHLRKYKKEANLLINKIKSQV